MNEVSGYQYIYIYTYTSVHAHTHQLQSPKCHCFLDMVQVSCSNWEDDLAFLIINLLDHPIKNAINYNNSYLSLKLKSQYKALWAFTI